ncbi:outer membrane beta-barrel protein [Hyphomicrobium sp. D-2]|uniref:outer membrane beta-barrel protein n=1 Tax=Hyphomicrobium sp. D-2 TaxID=3041621 RepID=UPI0024551A9B|nr:outer membrane beta-barrel protein [Hyphomicrobium sp. D-2]MDH4982583.1 outer membrane beta-barrel protein [Hyphomicrobium sp. D-2]
MGASVSGIRMIVGLLFGCAVIVGAARIFAPAPAVAQILDPPQRAAEPRRPLLRPTLPDDSVFEQEDQNAFDDGRFGIDQPAPRRPLLRPGTDDEGEGIELGTGVDSGQEQTAQQGAEGNALPGMLPADANAEDGRGRLTIAGDGDPVSLAEPQAPMDGVIDLSEPEAPMEGEEDITAADMRSPDDVRAFAMEPAGYDPLLLQADEINLIMGRSNFQGFVLDPFPQLGTRIGSFTLYSNVDAYYDYNSNLFASPVALGDSSLVLRPAGRLVSNWARHAVELRGSADFSFHDRYPSENDKAYLVEGLGRLDITSRTNLQGLIAHQEAQESRSAINAISVGSRPNINVDRYRAAFNHRFNRLSVQARGSIIDTSYSDDVIFGFLQSNADRNYTLYEQAFRPQWEFSPYLFLFSDIAINQRDYNVATYSDGINRSSQGERYRVGVSFGNVSEILRGSISLGYGRQQINNHELPVVDGLLIDADLAWQVTPLTTLQFVATSEVAETTTAGSPGVMERTYGLEARHSFTQNLVGIAGVGFMTRDFIGVGQTEEQFSGAVGADYYLNRWAVLFARYEYTDFQSSWPAGSYTANEIQAGVRLRH